jgi:hypothetical protein
MDRPTDLEGWPHPDFDKNHRAFPIEELWKHIGKHIAWNRDGTQIVADGATLGEVISKVEALGLKGMQVVFDYVDDPNVSSVGCL